MATEDKLDLLWFPIKIKFFLISRLRKEIKTRDWAKLAHKIPGVPFGYPKGMIADSKVILLMCPEIPVGGCLSKFLQNWEMITLDQWVLSIISEGYKLEFIEKPLWTGIKKTKVSAENLGFL